MINCLADADPIVDGVLKALLTAKISLGRLHGHVAEQKLDLVPVPLRHRGTGGRRSDGGRAVPDFRWLLFLRSPSRRATPPSPSYQHLDLTRPASASKDPALGYACGRKPPINESFDPARNRNRPNMSALADEVNNGPVILRR
jgi:hypothetical protein